MVLDSGHCAFLGIVHSASVECEKKIFDALIKYYVSKCLSVLEICIYLDSRMI